MNYKSTRSDDIRLSSAQAILQGLSDDGGLFIPESIPKFDKSLKEYASMDYRQLAYHIMKLFFTDFTETELKYCIDSAYDDKFDDKRIAPLRHAYSAYFLELFHGKTIAFKDMALSILPYLMTTAAKKENVYDDIVILTATSGDTGKAALAGFANVEGTKIVVFFPKDGVSPIQKRQMVTQEGDNTRVIAIHGNFDQAQTAVKEMFNDKALVKELGEKGYRFSSANSINIGRLVPQVVYYVYSYITLLNDNIIKEGDPINITVPTGNFGNILAAYFAKEMGLPVNKLICASNENKVLFDFFETGIYDKKRPFHLTSSPSMDILVSSNLERLIYIVAGEDSAKTKKLMEELNLQGRYDLTEDMRAKLTDFYGGFATQEETASAIKAVYETDGYVIDTHTAVAAFCYDKYRKQTGDSTPTVIASTASPYKFTRSVMEALGKDVPEKDDLALCEDLCSISKVDIPDAVASLKSAEIKHTLECDIEGMSGLVKEFLV